MTCSIRLSDVSKRFMIAHQSPTSFRDRFIRRTWRGGRVNELMALKRVSLSIQKGQIFGVLGGNGSGKSTLLRLIAGVMQPTKGTVETNGRIGALLDLAAGFHPELTGLENIELNGALLGMGPSEVKEKRDDIIGFSGLEEFIDTAVKYYSSGMMMRLGFSIAIHLDPDILLVDEVLAVGDESFQRKCLERILKLRDQQKTVLLVSHDMEQIKEMCGSAAWFNKGEVVCTGDPDEIVGRYLEFTDTKDKPDIVTAPTKRWGTREVEITEVEMVDDAGRAQTLFKTGQPWMVRIHYKAQRPIENPVFGLAIHRSDGIHITGPNTKTSQFAIDSVTGSGVMEYGVDSLPLTPGSYELSVAVYDRHIRRPIDHHEKLYSFLVGKGGTSERGGVVMFGGRWEHSVLSSIS